MNLIGILAPKGLYISDNVNGKSYFNTGLGSKQIANGANLKPTFHKDWFLVEGAVALETLTRMRNQPRANYRFELIDMSFEREDVPSYIGKDDMVKGEYGWALGEKYERLESLYSLESDEQPAIEVAVEFELVIVLELEEDLIEVEKFKYPRTKKWDTPQSYIRRDNIEHRVLDKIIFPSLVLPSRPTRLTSEESYALVREHVVRNIDSAGATITSNYDFCFTVEKVIRLAKPYSYKREVKTARGKSYRRRRYREIYVSARKMTVFEMTWAGATRRKTGHRGYTIIKGFEGANEHDLHVNIETYLAELMEIINAPLVDCPHCGGMGVVWDGVKFTTNK